MNKIRASAIGIVALFVVASVHAQTPVTLPSTFQHAIHSKVNGSEYQLTVVLPPTYESSPTIRFPTLYVMDGNRWARLLAVLLPRFAANAALPPFIVVGVDYPGETGRYQDYGPLSQRYFPMDPKRGAANFMRVMKDEIIAFVESTYRTDPRDRGIGGHSMGGLFTAYALLHESETFQRFWISSPSLFYDDEVLFKDFDSFRTKEISRPLYVFTDIGADEMPAMQSALERFGQKLVELRPDKVILRTLVVPETNHATVVPSVFVPALEHLYRYRPRVTPAAADLLRFAGDYAMPDGLVITLVTDGRDLLYQNTSIDYQVGGSLVRMIASAPHEFYLRGAGTEIKFEDGAGIPQRLRVRESRTEGWIEAVRLPPGTSKRPEQKPKLGRP